MALALPGCVLAYAAQGDKVTKSGSTWAVNQVCVSVTRFILPLGATAVGYSFTATVCFLGAVFAVPLLFALSAGERLYAGIFAELAAGSFGVGSFFRRGQAPELELPDSALFIGIVIYQYR